MFFIFQNNLYIINMDFEHNVISILTGILGEPKRDYTSSGGWIEYNCPCCADEVGHPDGKYNLAITVDELYGHCWRCGYTNKLSSIIRKYGSSEDLEDYKHELSTYKESRLFSLYGALNDSVEDLDKIDGVDLPDGFKLINTEEKTDNDATRYLKKRGVDDFLIKKYNIGYCGRGHGIYSERIVIPSYDAFGNLNYWFGRDYTGKNGQWSKLNPKIDKKSIIFNEYFINWYEPITLVEGPFDHIVVPNSIPLLGKAIDEESMVYKALVAKAHSTVNIFLDDDAIETAYKTYKFLNNAMKGKIRVIECPNGYDASDYYRDFGKAGIIRLLKTAHTLDEFTLTTI